jgi:anti-sigma28 factor (negative regulator of flagellin synthesis)
MDVRIQGGHLNGVEGAAAQKIESTPAPVSPSSAAGTNQLVQGDRIEISTISEAITAARGVMDSERAGIVKALGALYNNGTYSVPSEKVADAVVARALDADGQRDVK